MEPVYASVMTVGMYSCMHACMHVGIYAYIHAASFGVKPPQVLVRSIRQKKRTEPGV